MSDAFPGAGAQIYRNEDGEVLGWDYPDTYEPEYCDVCGYHHAGACPSDSYDDEHDYCKRCGEDMPADSSTWAWTGRQFVHAECATEREGTE